MSPTSSRITLAPPDSLSAYVGMLAHEEKHELDFWNVIWQGNGYDNGQDRDNDWLRDAWERTQPMAEGTGYGPWIFDVPAGPSGTPAAVPGRRAGDDHQVWLESTGDTLSWSDKRADVAAKNAIDADLGIDAQDWSDLHVRPGKPWMFKDDNRPEHEYETAKPTTSGNNKQYQP